MGKPRHCAICHARNLELDTTGRCGSCAAVLRAKGLNLSYGNLIALETNQGREIAQPEIVVELPPVFDATCAFCGRGFYRQRRQAKYCGDECRYQAKLVQSRDFRRTQREEERRGKRISG